MKITKIIAVAKACTAMLLLLALLFCMSGCVKDELTTGLTIENSTTTDWAEGWSLELEMSSDNTIATYIVYNAEGLLAWNQAVQDDLTLNCTLAKDIDLTDIEYTWLLVGNYYNQYTGTFDGDGHTITGLTIDKEDTNYVGLIGCLGEGGKVQNLTLNNVKITGSNYVGSVVGENYGTVTNCTASGSVTGSSNVGGVVGNNYNIVTACYHATVSVSSSGNYVGGVVGVNCGTVTDCSASSNVTGDSSSYVGGVVGYNYYGTVTACYSTGNVSDSNYVGGVVGRNYYGTVTACYYASGSVTGFYFVGGVVGRNDGTVTACYSSGDVSASSYYIGGVVGQNQGTVTACYWSSDPSDGIGTGTTSGATKVENEVTWEVAVGYMNDAIYEWDSSCEWRYEIAEGNTLPTLKKVE